MKQFLEGDATFTVALCSSIKPKSSYFAKHEIICTFNLRARRAL
jgi:hypothetical protein